MPEMMPQGPAGSTRAEPDVMSFLLLVAVLVLLAATVYIIYLGCTDFGAAVFFRSIYAPQQAPEIAARTVGLLGG